MKLRRWRVVRVALGHETTTSYHLFRSSAVIQAATDYQLACKTKTYGCSYRVKRA